MERKLAAIMVADVVGYSRLMESDEQGTLSAVTERRKEVIEPFLAMHGGRIVKLMGDGVLAEFASAVNAVQCALDIQKGMSAANDGVPNDRKILLRIGINLGDIIFEAGDVYGDGVNIAARLESLADPETVLISGTIYDQVKNKNQWQFEDIGAQSLKNISNPVRTYRVSIINSPKPAQKLPFPSKPSIAVLPFDNMSGDPEQQYFSDGTTEDIITELSRFRQLFVIARNSSFVFREKPVDIGEIGQRLGVRYLVEGSIRRMGDRVRVTAQLIDTTTSAHVWADRYDRELKDLFSIQDELVQTIVATVAGRLEVDSMKQLRQKPTENLTAYDCYLRGIEYHQRFTDEDAERAREMLERAVRLDPDFSLPLPWLALMHASYWHRTGSASDLDQAFALAQKAVALDEDDSRGHNILGFIYLEKRHFQRAEAHLSRAVLLNPNDGHAAAHLADFYAYIGRPEDALDWIEKAIRLNPFHPDWYSVFRAEAFYAARRYGDAAASLERATTLSVSGHTVAAACFAMAGMNEDAQTHAAQVLTREPTFSSRAQVAREPFKFEADAEHFLEGLRRAGLPE